MTHEELAGMSDFPMAYEELLCEYDELIKSNNTKSLRALWEIWSHIGGAFNEVATYDELYRIFVKHELIKEP